MATPGVQPRPAVLSVRIAGIPMVLRQERRWILWKYVLIVGERGSKWTKVPFQPDGRQASSTNDLTWNDFDTAVAAYQTGRFDGLGFVLGNGWIGIDVDDCIRAGLLSPLAERLLAGLDGHGYAEVSPSGTGFKLITRGDVPSKADHTLGLERYAAGRYFAITGCQINGHCDIPEMPQSEIILRLTDAEFGQGRPAAPRRSPQPAGLQGMAALDPPLGMSENEIQEYLHKLPADDYSLWIRIGQALHHESRGEEWGLDIWDAWSATAGNYIGRQDLETRWGGFGKDRGSWVTLRTLLHEVRAKEEAAADQLSADLETDIRNCQNAKELMTTLASRAHEIAKVSPWLKEHLIKLIRDQSVKIGKPITLPAARKAVTQGSIKPGVKKDGMVLDPANPYDTALKIAAQQAETMPIYYQSGGWWLYVNTHYRTLLPEAVRKGIWATLSKSVCHGENGVSPFKPVLTDVNNVLDALKAVADMSEDVKPPCWLDNRAGPDPAHLLPMRNGLLDVRSRQLHPHDKNFWSVYSLPYDWEGETHSCPRWRRFLDEIFPNDDDSQATLEEIMGYCLMPDNRYQKLFLMVGDTRSGKGTIGRVLRALIGESNVIGPQMSTLSNQYGLQNWIGVPLAIIPDARLSHNSDTGIIKERIMGVTGGDTLTVERKWLTHWTGVLPTRIIILSNKIPYLPDAASALAERFVVLHFKQSFLHREDINLTDDLMRELPAILTRVLHARDRLHARGRFHIPDAAQQAMDDLRTAISGISEWVRTNCEINEAYSCSSNDLYSMWKTWCREVGREHPGSMHTFLCDLRAAHPKITTVKAQPGVRAVTWGIRPIDDPRFTNLDGKPISNPFGNPFGNMVRA